MVIQNKSLPSRQRPRAGSPTRSPPGPPNTRARAGHIGQRDGAHEAAPARVGNLFITPAAHLTGEKEIFAAPQIKHQRPYAICNVVCLLPVPKRVPKRYRNLAFFFNSRGDPQLSGRCRSNPTPRRCRRPARPIVRLRLIARRASITNLKVTAGISVLACPPTG